MKAKLKLARIGMNMEEGTIVNWNFTEGESFKTGDVLYEVETEKVTNEVEAPGDGTLLEILVSEGEIAVVGQDVCVVESA
ncbi:MAG: lipoyl domain-containing protein [Pseudomonadota bacterium]|nr:lipoyl domain-containing protein [Pseudomonadota bacterium]